MLDQYVKSAHGFLVMFALNDKRSLHDAEYYIERVNTWTDSGKKPMILVGNKKDLCEAERQVHPKEIQDLANKYNIQCTMEASGKTAENVQNAFFTLAEMAYCSYTELFVKLEKGKSIVADEKKKKCSVM
jgi:GTPase SAR1 family protein